MRMRDAGNYSVIFIGSGVSFTRFAAQPQDGGKAFVQVKKMIMMKQRSS